MERRTHAWRIEDREYARQEARRGRPHAITSSGAAGRDHNATLYTIYRTFGDVRTTDEVIDLIRT
jgi:hypothetical protein